MRAGLRILSWVLFYGFAHVRLSCVHVCTCWCAVCVSEQPWSVDMCWTGTLQRAFAGKCCLQQGRARPFLSPSLPLPIITSLSAHICLHSKQWWRFVSPIFTLPLQRSVLTGLKQSKTHPTLITRAGPQPNTGPQHDLQASPRLASHLMVHHCVSQWLKSQIESPPLQTWGPIQCVLVVTGRCGRSTWRMAVFKIYYKKRGLHGITHPNTHTHTLADCVHFNSPVTSSYNTRQWLFKQTLVFRSVFCASWWTPATLTGSRSTIIDVICVVTKLWQTVAQQAPG